MPARLGRCTRSCSASAGVESKRASRSGEPLALLLLDIDDFKALNDRFGHSVGDEVLRRVAYLMNDTVRETDLPARYGGEEFAVLAPRTGREGAMALDADRALYRAKAAARTAR